MTEQVWPKKGGDGTSVALLSLDRDSFASARYAQGRAVGWPLCAESMGTCAAAIASTSDR
jgi:hypothetical protein